MILFILKGFLALVIGYNLGYLYAKYLNEKANNKILSDEIRRLEIKDNEQTEMQ